MKSGLRMKLSLVPSGGAVRQPSADALSLARSLRALAERAERGELVGAAVALWAEHGEAASVVAGLFKRDKHAAHYATCRLADHLLWPDSGG